MTYDLKITGGTIVDGSGKPGFAGDIGIKDGKVVAMGKADGPAATTIDAADRLGEEEIADHVGWEAMSAIDLGFSVSKPIVAASDIARVGAALAHGRPERTLVFDGKGING